MEDMHETKIGHLAKLSARIDKAFRKNSFEPLRLSIEQMNILHDASIDFWREVMVEQEIMSKMKAEAIQKLMEAFNEDDPEEDMMSVTGIIDIQEQCLYFPGHKITIDEDGKVVTHHTDGSLCDIACPGCNEPDIFVHKEGEQFYTTCHTCEFITDSNEERFVTVGDWLLGKAFPKKKSYHEGIAS